MTQKKRKPSQKIHPRASRDRDEPHYGISSSVGFIPWPRWATTIYPHKTPPFTPIMHPCSRLRQTHISLLQTFVYGLNPLSFGLPAGRFITYSPLYIRLTNRLSFILST